MPKDYHEDLGNGPSRKTHAAEQESFKETDQLEDHERARSQAGEGFRGQADEYQQTGYGQAGYRATKRPSARRKPR